jgi:hypothetical protein
MDPQGTQDTGAFGASTLTLVEPTARRDTVLVFALDNMHNTVVGLLGIPSQPLYTIKSNRDLTVTELKRGGRDGLLVAKIEYRTLLPDQVLLRSRGFQPMKIRRWLREIKSVSK